MLQFRRLLASITQSLSRKIVLGLIRPYIFLEKVQHNLINKLSCSFLIVICFVLVKKCGVMQSISLNWQISFGVKKRFRIFNGNQFFTAFFC